MQVTDHEYAEPASRMQLAKKLSHLTSYSEFIIILLGVSGSGRSTLLDQLEWEHEPRTQRIARINLDATADVTGILKALVSTLGLNNEALQDNRKRLAAIHRQLKALHDVDISLHLQIDNADFLSDNALELILSLFQLGESAPHLLLTAKPEFEQRAEEKDVFARFENRIHIQRLEPFSETEAEDYVLSLLPSHVDLNSRQLKKLIAASSLQPGSLTATVEAFISQGGLNNAKINYFPFPPLHMSIIAGVLVLITGLAAWHYFPSTSSPDTQMTRVDISPRPIVSGSGDVAEVTARDALGQRLAEEEARQKITSADDDEVVAVSETVEPEAVTVSQQLRSEHENVVVSKAESDDARLSALADQDIAGQEMADPQVEAVHEPEQPQFVADSDELKQDADEVAVEELVQPQPLQKAVVSSPAPRVVSETPAAGSSATTASVTAGSQAEILLGWPDTGYTLQMLGARSEESVIRFIQSQEQPQRFYRFKALFQGAPWHVVVYGQYPTRAAAMEAVRGLPADLRDRNPWARTISSVKEDIKKIDQ